MKGNNEHVSVVLNLSRECYQAVCTCGWTSSTSFFEEVDLIRAIHAHEVVALGIEP